MALLKDTIVTGSLRVTDTTYTTDLILSGSKTARYALIAPTSDGAPTFRALTNADVGLGNVENTKLSTWVGTNKITTLGTITTGTWSATAIAANKGGTGQTAYTIGDILYCGTANTLSKLGGNTTTTRKFLRSVATTSGTAVAPAWDTVTKTDVGLSNVENTKLSTWAGTSNITTVGTIGTGTWQGTAVGTAYGGTGNTSFTQWGVIYANPATKLVSTAAGTAGYLLQGNGSAAPSWIQATNSNTASTIVKRDASGNFSAGTITAALSGNASTATALTSNAGSTTCPIYFTNGKPSACNQPKSGAWYSSVPMIGSDGVMEVGKYIDFHDGNTITADHSARITASSTGLTLSGTTSIGYLEVRAQDSTYEGGEIKLLPATSSLKACHIDNFNNTLRIHDGANVPITMDITTGKITTNGTIESSWNANTAHFKASRTDAGESSMYFANNTAGWAIGVNVWGIGAGGFGIGQYAGTGSSAWRFRIDNNGFCYTSNYLYLGGGHENNASSPPCVLGFNGSDNYIRSYQTASLIVDSASRVYNTNIAVITGLLGVSITTGHHRLALQADGNCVYYDSQGNAVWYTGASSRQIKDNIHSLTDKDISNFMKLNAVSFNYKPKFKIEGYDLSYGLIAEEVLELYPDLVKIPKNYKKEEFDIEKGYNQPFITIHYEGFIPLLIKMVQKQQKEIEELRAKINK